MIRTKRFGTSLNLAINIFCFGKNYQKNSKAENTSAVRLHKFYSVNIYKIQETPLIL